MSALADRIGAWLAEWLRESGAQGFVVGLSGGVDSAVTAVLAQRASAGRTLGVLMPCHSRPKDVRLAYLLARTFGIETIAINLAPAYEALLGALPPAGRIPRANLKPRLRMTTLYYLANQYNYLVVGTGNRSELAVGYFTKYGDGGVDLLPLGDLLKTQVWDLARELGVPDAIVDRAPSAGLWEGQTDEDEMGITYAELDMVFTALDRRDADEIDPALLAKVRGMVARSAHKRASLPIYHEGSLQP